LRLAERLGGDVVRLSGSNISDEIVKYALQHNVTRIVLGVSRRPEWQDRIFGNILNDILRKVDGVDVMVVSGIDDGAINPIMGWGKKRKPEFIKNHFWPYVAIMILVLLITGVNYYLREAVDYSNTLMLYLLPVLVAAVKFGLWPSLVASFLSIVFYKLFFSESSILLNLPNPGDFASMLLFLFVAIFASNLAARVSLQANTATRRARMTASLYEFSRKLAGIGSLHDLLHTVVNHIAVLMRVKAALIMPHEGRLQLRAAYPATFTLNDGEMAATSWCYENSKPAGMDTETLQSLDKLFLPLNTAEGTVGVLVIHPEPETRMDRDEQKLLNALTDQAAIAIERMEYSINIAKSQLRRLADRVTQGLERP
jgi:two-component system, OmpR family, sensor histidine kinase KdpD